MIKVVVYVIFWIHCLFSVNQVVAIVYEIFLIHSEDDKHLVEQIIPCFNAAKKRFKKSVSVTTLLDVTVKEASWQYDVVSAMMASTRWL